MTLRSLAISKGQSAKRTRSKEKAARMGARQLFKQLDGCDIPGTPSDGPADGIQHAVSRHESGMLQQSGDNVLTEAELFDGLVAADMLIPLELFSSLFKEIDSSGDGAISIAEFAEFVASTEPWPAGEAHRAALGALWRRWTFWLAFTLVVGELLLLATSFLDDGQSKRSFSLVGTCLVILGCTCVTISFVRSKPVDRSPNTPEHWARCISQQRPGYSLSRNARRFVDRMRFFMMIESSKFKLRRAVLRHVEELSGAPPRLREVKEGEEGSTLLQ